MTHEHADPVYTVIVAPAANDRMYEHFSFLARVNENAATRLLDTLMKDIRSLASMPYRNPVYDRPYVPSGQYRYLISHGRYRVVYRIENKTVYVDDIQDCRQPDAKSPLCETK
jgi:plasmid stabilization system protein ParE